MNIHHLSVLVLYVLPNIKLVTVMKVKRMCIYLALME